jgi:hypothetical protein
VRECALLPRIRLLEFETRGFRPLKPLMELVGVSGFALLVMLGEWSEWQDLKARPVGIENSAFFRGGLSFVYLSCLPRGAFRPCKGARRLLYSEAVEFHGCLCS